MKKTVENRLVKLFKSGQQMKNLYAFGIAVVFIVLVSITSCNKDDIQVDPIVGEWEYSETQEDFSRTITMTFMADNTGLEEIDYIIYGQPDSRNSNFVYLLNEGILTLIFGVEPNDYPYNISENKLTITYPDEVLTFTRK
jgi:hypothetical protein